MAAVSRSALGPNQTNEAWQRWPRERGQPQPCCLSCSSFSSASFLLVRLSGCFTVMAPATQQAGSRSGLAAAGTVWWPGGVGRQAGRVEERLGHRLAAPWSRASQTPPPWSARPCRCQRLAVSASRVTGDAAVIRCKSGAAALPWGRRRLHLVLPHRVCEDRGRQEAARLPAAAHPACRLSHLPRGR